ncbi:Basic-leucine zipper domain [Arabidopsis suecica]|jgi:regulator of replication initiation timing|uniref:Basic leucine zipper 34 n=2 Tax=Arabidopsis TaxID=3701 RepID=BZP34_ARATH|nr:Basic-leucine zipper (bZIP) transcription factor family protein [Arabidopsis thaliana]F4IN23.1 RecName: Full=Basic leucine zipper 34; Short=AtbZIP34; Short=bZIP protein 34 [Arabidopsis thaliana]AEC10114.1 Basic-leucine zipper (bZIP) transcription factor family protein [Arabidopsis thaliana]KAG7644028.1 Basic-leucine zipper domain [Arabidopsis suecica]|eukprot:NP_850369.1 Basic-leucine zipper (bZIP) transcription factor family protein [Arabidopsis thaliana]
MAQLPPKIPNMTQHWPDFSSQKLSPFSTPTATAVATATTTVQNPSWVDEFLDFSASRRGNHRRSISDSIAFLEAPTVSIEDHQFDRFDDEQFMSMFTDDDNLHSNPSHINNKNNNVGPTGSSSNTSTPSNSFNDDNKELPPSDHNMNNNINNNYNDEVQSQCKMEPEDGTASNNNSGDSSGNRILDPKRVKRILANRQSAQRSRVRKLQYISELERSVTSLQAEVSVLSPRVAFLDHQRLLLNVDNSALKQRIAALSQDKLFKDAHQEALKREIERLRQVYNQQSLTNVENANHLSATGAGATPAVDIKSSVETEQLLNVS